MGHGIVGRARQFIERMREQSGKFLRNTSGNVVLVFGLTLVPMLGFIGGAIDYAYAYKTRTQLQNALDAAALAAGREMGQTSSQSGAQQVANDVLQANLGSNFPPGVSADFNIADSTVTATASINVDTFLLNVLGISYFPVEVTSLVNIAGGTFEVVMALDNSGSMSGSKISDLRNAAKNLVNILFSNELSSDHVQIGLVPFAASVNVGSQYSGASWMDQTGQSSIHRENYEDPSNSVTRWDILNMIPNASWAGCVEARPAPHDVNDTEPVGGDTLFVPMFAPDEPDNSSSYINDYIDDDDGDCHWSISGGSSDERQRRLCKYDGEWANTSLSYGTRLGPNHLCDSPPLQPLTNNHSQITAAINAMNAYGGTNIVQGMMWGWRLLSPTEPFTEGKPYDEPNHTKILILMSDGENFHYGTWNHNESWFNAYGYHAQGRLGSPSNNTSTLKATMNDRTAAACNNVKAAGVVVYTLALEVSSQSTQDLLEGCASSPSRFFTIDDSDSLDDVFEAIAKEIQKLRIAS